jgi:hypothetical protein
MSEITVGSVGVEVVPDARQFAKRVRAQILPDAARVGNDFGKTLGDAAQKRIADGIQQGRPEGRPQCRRRWREGRRHLRRPVRHRHQGPPRRRVQVPAGGEARRGLHDVDRTIDGIRTHLAELRDKRIGVDISGEEALAQIDRIEGRLRSSPASRRTSRSAPTPSRPSPSWSGSARTSAPQR